MYGKSFVGRAEIIHAGGKRNDLRGGSEFKIRLKKGNEGHFRAEIDKIAVVGKIRLEIIIKGIGFVYGERGIDINPIFCSNLNLRAVEGREIGKIMQRGEHAAIIHIMPINYGIAILG